MSRHPQIIAHRGARLVTPENTLPAFEKAIEMGADGIELDVHMSKDGKLVVLHNFTLDDTTNGIGAVDQLTAAELANLDAGSHFSSEFAGTPIPTLEQVFDLVGDRCRINVEIKSMSPTGGAAVEPLVEMIRARNLFDQVIISSFNPITLIKCRWMESTLELGLLFQEKLPAHLASAWFSPVIHPQAVHPWKELVDGAFVIWARERGCAINVWTVNDAEEAKRLYALGVDGIITDAPDLMIRELFA